MNVDSSYAQYINSLMNDETFELPSGCRRFSIGSHSSDHPEESNVNESATTQRERTFSWGDTGLGFDPAYEDLLQNLGRKRAMSEMSSDSDFNYRALRILASTESPPEDRALRSVAFPPPPLPVNELPVPVSNYQQLYNNAQLQFPQRFQLLIQNSGFISDSSLISSTMIPSSMLQCRPEDVKVGSYTKLQRQEKIAKYRAKRSQRVFRKLVKYDCRKKLADTRPRVKGRFVTKVGDDAVEFTPRVKLENDPCPAPGEEEPLEAIHADTSCESFS